MLCNMGMAQNTQITWYQGRVPYEHLNALEAGTAPLAADGQDAMDLAEYLLAGVLEAGPDNGMPEEFTSELFRVWHLLAEAHSALHLREPYYHPTS